MAFVRRLINRIKIWFKPKAVAETPPAKALDTPDAPLGLYGILGGSMSGPFSSRHILPPQLNARNQQMMNQLGSMAQSQASQIQNPLAQQQQLYNVYRSAGGYIHKIYKTNFERALDRLEPDETLKS